MFKKKISVFIPSLRGGGAERVMLNLSGGFHREGYDVCLVVAEAKGPYLKSVPPGVKIVDLKSKHVRGSVFGLIKFLRENKPDVMLSALTHANIVALIAKKFSGVHTKIFISERNTLSQVLRYSRSMRERVFPLIMRYLYPTADGIVAISKGVAGDLCNGIGLPREKVKVIYNPVVINKIIQESEETFDKHIRPHFQSSPIILGVGRLTKQKDFSTLIKAFKIVINKIPAHLVILGEGEDRDKLESLTIKLDFETQVFMPGYVDNPYKYMKRASVLVLSSVFEGFGNVLLEALALGTPVVSTNCLNGPKEILDGGRFGKLVPIGDHESLARAIIETIQFPPQSDILIDRAREFSLNKICRQYLSYFFEIS